MFILYVVNRVVGDFQLTFEYTNKNLIVCYPMFPMSATTTLILMSICKAYHFLPGDLFY